MEELEQEEDFKAATRFTERNIGKCYKIAVKYYYLFYLLPNSVPFLGTVSLSILGTDIFYNNHLHMQSMIIYNILNT